MVCPGGDEKVVGWIDTPGNCAQAAREKQNTNNRLINFRFIRVVLINKMGIPEIIDAKALKMFP